MSLSLIDVCTRPSPTTSLAALVLFLMVVAVVSIAIERLVFYGRSGGVDSVLEAGRRANEAGAGRGERRRIMERAAREHRYALGQGLRGLLTVGLLAPAVGLLASLAGATQTFRAVALTSSESLVILVYGLSEALAPLAWALGVGFVSLWSYTAFERRRAGIALEMAKVVVE